jgi:hypothetical protein
MNESILPPAAVTELERAGKQYAAIQKAVSKKQWYFGTFVNSLWHNLPIDAQEEIPLELFYVECSAHINSGLDFPVVGESGRTLRLWCETAAHYETFPGLLTWQTILTFDHFVRARKIGADPNNNITSAECLARAVVNKWTATEMESALIERQIYTAAEQELFSLFPKWAQAGARPLLGLNGSRAEAQFHYAEFVRLVESDKKL